MPAVVRLPAGQTVRIQPIFNYRSPHRVAVRLEDGREQRWESDPAAGRDYGAPWSVVLRGHDPHFAVAQVLITHHDTGGWHEGMWQVTPVDHITNANTGEGASRCIVFYENLLGPFGGGAGFIGWRDVAVVFLWHD